MDTAQSHARAELLETFSSPRAGKDFPKAIFVHYAGEKMGV